MTREVPSGALALVLGMAVVLAAGCGGGASRADGGPTAGAEARAVGRRAAAAAPGAVRSARAASRHERWRNRRRWWRRAALVRGTGPAAGRRARSGPARRFGHRNRDPERRRDRRSDREPRTDPVSRHRLALRGQRRAGPRDDGRGDLPRAPGARDVRHRLRRRHVGVRDGQHLGHAVRRRSAQARGVAARGRRAGPGRSRRHRHRRGHAEGRGVSRSDAIARLARLHIVGRHDGRAGRLRFDRRRHATA